MKILTSFVLVAASISCAPGQNVKYKAAWANTPDCSLKILGAGFTSAGVQADVFGQVTLANASKRQVTSAQLAWSIESGGAAGVVFGFGPTIALKLAPGDVVGAGAQGADVESVFKILGAMPSGGGTVTLSVVLVKYSDGTEWRREVDSGAPFKNTESPKEYAPFEEKHQELIREMQGGPE
jgi:hypothetical protein